MHCVRGFLILLNMEYRYYLGYKVYENGNVENDKGVVLKPQLKGNYSFFKIKGEKISCARFILFSFGDYPKCLNQKAKRKDGNPINNSLYNLSW